MNEAMGIVVGAAITAVPMMAGVCLTLRGATRQARVAADALLATTQMQIDSGREAVRRQARRAAYAGLLQQVEKILAGLGPAEADAAGAPPVCRDTNADMEELRVLLTGVQLEGPPDVEHRARVLVASLVDVIDAFGQWFDAVSRGRPDTASSYDAYIEQCGFARTEIRRFLRAAQSGLGE